MDDDELRERLTSARQRVQSQRQQMKGLRMRLREAHATSSAIVTTAVSLSLEARGVIARPPVPPYPPDDLDR